MISVFNKFSKTHLLLIGGTFFWGLNFHLGQIATDYVSPMVASTYRYIFAVMGLWVLVFANRQNRVVKLEIIRFKQKWIYFILITLAGIFLFNYFFFKGLSSTLAVNGSLIISINPAVTLLLSLLFLSGIIKRNHIIGLVLSLFGVIIVIFKGNLSNFLTMDFYPGDLWMLIATTLFALHHIFIQKYIPSINAFVLTVISSTLGLIMFLIYNMPELYTLNYSNLDYVFWISIVTMGIAGTTFSFIAWNRGVIELGASGVSMFLNLIPVWAAITGLFFGKEISLFQLFGGIFIISGIYLTLKKR